MRADACRQWDGDEATFCQILNYYVEMIDAYDFSTDILWFAVRYLLRIPGIAQTSKQRLTGIAKQCFQIASKFETGKIVPCIAGDMEHELFVLNSLDWMLLTTSPRTLLLAYLQHHDTYVQKVGSFLMDFSMCLAYVHSVSASFLCDTLLLILLNRRPKCMTKQIIIMKRRLLRDCAAQGFLKSTMFPIQR